ncbi:hypothetical protein SDJN03_26288, partial [Cucurbita argyrosperma subsp. sororia]
MESPPVPTHETGDGWAVGRRAVVGHDVVLLGFNFKWNSQSLKGAVEGRKTEKGSPNIFGLPLTQMAAEEEVVTGGAANWGPPSGTPWHN